jgi:integrase
MLKTTKKLPALCQDKSTGWFFSVLRDPSKPSGRARRYWSKDKAEARKLYKENIEKAVTENAAKAGEAYTDAGDWSLVDLASKYYERKAQDGVSPAHLGAIKRYLGNERKKPMQFLPWLARHGFSPARQGPADLTTALLAGYREQLAKDKAKGRREANHYIEHVRCLLLWGAEMHGLRHPPLGVIRPFARAAKTGHGRTQDRTPLEWATLEKLFAAADPVDAALLWLGLNVGFGNTDIGVLRLADVDLEKGKISNTRQKTGAQRDFDLWPETVMALRVYLAGHRGKPRTEAIADRFFVGRKGLPMTWEEVTENGTIKRSDAVKCRFDRLCERAGVKLPYGAGFYILRHTYATRIGEGSEDLREVQAAMGHITLQQQQTYRHDMASKARSAQARLHDALIAKAPMLSRPKTDDDRHGVPALKIARAG